MKKSVSAIIIIIAMMSSIFPKEFNLISKQNDKMTISFIAKEVNFDAKEGFVRLVDSETPRTVDEGMPELPIQTTFFQMEAGISYSVEYTIISSHIEENVKVFPFQGEENEGESRPFINNIEFYQSNQVYPVQNITLSDPMVMRDIEVGLITFIPFKYYAETQSLEVFDQVEINIIETGERIVNENLPSSRSLMFEPMYEDMVINYEPLSNRDEYQSAAILYICGGNAIDNPYIQSLFDWREKQGYTVFTVSTSETGTSTSNVKDYIRNAYLHWDNPPEIVGLIGDTGGSYPIATFTIQGGAGDNEYAYLEGNDFLPEIFIGRISVSSSSDISNIITKTLVYEQATEQEDWWYERAALIGDPSSSGLSTITTMQYIENIMTNYGMNDIRTNYGNGSYNNFADNQFTDGILYYNYRGYYGQSSISVSGMNSGVYAPFAATVTCGTGDFNGTSSSENFIRAGSATNPKGAVACVGVSTTGTHTMYNNILHMGIFEGAFSRGMYHAGAALAQGKLALLKTYPTNPYSCVTKFSQWANLMGDPALHLWTDKPKDFIVDHVHELPSGINLLEATVTDENGDPVADARVTLRLDAYGIFTSSYTDQTGQVILSWYGDGVGEASFTVFKHNFRLYDGLVSMGQVSGPAIYLDYNRSTIIDDQFGNNNGELNPGEIVDLQLTLINLGSESSQNVSVNANAENDKLIILINDFIIDEITSSGNGDEIHLSLSLDISAIQDEELGLSLDLSDNENNNWNINVPLQVHGSKLEIINYEVIGQELLESGIDSEINLVLKNNGSTGIEDIDITLFSPSNNIAILSDAIHVNSMPAGSEVILSSFILQPNENIINGTDISLQVNFSSSSGYANEGFISVRVGERDVDDPMGPDSHGYFIYDTGDTDYPLAPVYDWYDIVDNQVGTNLNFTDAGDGCYSTGGWYGCNGYPDDVHTMDLPFNFQFYGVVYDEITISSNGWITFGESDMSSFRNYSIPGAGGPSPMVAAFWDDLTTDNGGQVYKYVTDEFVIIQWSNLRTHQHNDLEKFQIILYSSEYSGYITPTGDGEIKIQYHTFNNTTNGNHAAYPPQHGSYTTIGIENHLGNLGMEYTFDSNYDEAAMPLSNGTALFITTSLGENFMLGDLNQDEMIDVLDVVTVINIILNIIVPNNYQIFAGDMTNDGVVNVLDIVLIVNIILDA